MDFEDTREEAEFRAEVRGWLAEQAAEYDLSNHGELTMISSWRWAGLFRPAKRIGAMQKSPGPENWVAWVVPPCRR